VQTLSTVAAALVLIVAVGQVRSGALSVGALIAYLLYIDMVFSPIQQLSQVFDGYQQAAVGLSRIKDLLRLRTTVPPAVDPVPVPAAGLSGQAFITNTVYWRPPGNRTPTPGEQMACAPFLDRAVTLVKPKALLLVGGAAAKSVLKKDEGILRLRGRWFDWRSSDGALELPAMPTLHPAFLLRDPRMKGEAWKDLQRVMAEMGLKAPQKQ